jgi:hypothetical protein
LRFLRVGVVNSRIDLRGGKIATRSQLRRIQLHDHLSFVQSIPFPRENFLHTPAEARTHMGFVHFNSSGNRLATIFATSEQQE